jgi:hypothetical protein
MEAMRITGQGWKTSVDPHVTDFNSGNLNSCDNSVCQITYVTDIVFHTWLKCKHVTTCNIHAQNELLAYYTSSIRNDRLLVSLYLYTHTQVCPLLTLAWLMDIGDTWYKHYAITGHPACTFVKGKGLPQQAQVAQGVLGRLRPWIFLMLGTTRVVGRQPYASAVFTPGEIPSTHF